MRLVQRGIANNFGLVGKNIRRYLTTTALTATGLMAIATPALADGSWSNFDVVSGSQTVTTPDVNTTNIEVHTMDATVRGDADIAALDTVNLNQLSSKSKYIVHDTKSDPTKIMGKLNANGRVYIFDKNGVIFGEGSQVNVGSIVAGAGEGVVNPDTGSVELNDIADGGAIVNDGSITVAEGGLAAFVAPSVVNNGVINAKAGTVALASGNKVTLDLYGDGLVSIATEGELSNAIVENKGVISASGGNVALTVAAAKDAVDSVVNMDGIIDVSSSTGKGGKVSINGGNKGTVNVAGNINASGTQGGTVDVKGQNINVASTSLTQASGIDAKIDFIAQDHMDFRGSVIAKDAAVEVSGYGSLGFSGLVDAKTLLLDPEWAVIHSGVLNNPLGLGYVLSAQALANSMQSGTLVTVQADDFIDVGTRNTAYNTGNVAVDAILNALIGTGDIDLSTYNYNQLEVVGSTTVGICPFCVSVPTIGLVNYTGTTQSDIKFQSTTINFNKNLKMGDGDVVVDATNVNLFARLYDKVGGLLGDARISSNADKVNVVSNAATIQQGIWLADDAGGATVEVGDGIYTENVSINKGLKLVSKNGRDVTKINGISGVGTEATVQIENGANNVQLGDIGKGFTVVGIDNGNAAIENAALYLRGNHSNIDIIGNDIVANGDLGLLSLFGGVMSDITIDSNIFSGKTFDGAAPATGNQFVVPNVARPLVFFGNAATKSNIKFTNNQVTGTAGAGTAGNLLVNIDSTGATITGNTFNGTTGGTQGSLRARGTNTLISGNTFYAAGLPDAGYHVYITPSAYAGTLGQDDILDIWNSNTFVGRATVTDSDLFAGFDFIGLTIQGAVDSSTVTGADIYVNGGATYNESVLVNKSAYLHGANAGKAGYDLTRGPESIVDPNSPGFKVIADNVTIDGFLITGATGVDGYGVWVDVGADNATIKNNVINNVTQNAVFADTALNTVVENNKIDTTGSHGILVKNSANASVLGNEIGLNGGALNINGDGVQILQSNGAQVKKNKIANTTQTEPNIGSGVHTISSNNVVIEDNKTDNTGWDGVRVNLGDNALVKNNDIDNAFRTGVYLGQTTNSSAIGNDIDGVGNYGINLDRGANVTADGNFIDGTGLDGIRALRNATSTVKNNQIGQTGVAGNIKGNGIIVDGGSNSTVDNNKVGYTLLDGIHVISTNGAKVTNNNVTITAGEGIEFLNAVGTLEISKNNIDDTESHGILVGNSANIQVLENLIGLDGGALNINGDGVQILQSNGAQVKKNKIANTTQTEPNIGSGVHTISSNNVVIEDNKTDNTGWDGVRVNLGDNALVKNNDIDNAFRTGVYLGQTTNSSAIGNDIDGVGNYGINLDRGANVTADGNFIDGTGLDGIRALRNATSTVKNNQIGQTGVAGNIKGNGIIVDGGSNSTVDNNKVGYTLLDGIHVISTTNASVTKNDIDVTGDEGIHMIDAKGTLLVSENTVDKTKKHGIRITNSDAVKVLTNYVGLTGGAQNINGDGIRVEFSDDVLVQSNQVTNTRSPHNNQGNGVHSIESNRTQILNNILWNTKWDGVRVEKGTGVVVSENDIDNVTRSGVFAIDTNDTVISNNTIDYVGHRGVYVYGGNNITIDNNDIDYALGSDSALNDGVRVDNVNGIVIKNNDIGTDGGANNIGRNGIYAYNNTNLMTIELNDIDDVGGDGIDVYGFDTVLVKNNDVRDAVDNGILVQYGSQATITGNVGLDGTDNGVSNVGKNGIKVGNVDDITIDNNEVQLAGWDGIHVEYFNTAFINNNLVEQSGDDGIEAHNGIQVEISNNTVLDSGYGILAPGEGGVDYDGYDEFNSGHDGIHVTNIIGSGKIIASRIASLVAEEIGSAYIRITGNTVDLSADDGVDVDNSQAYTYVVGNTISDSGVTDEGATVIYDGVDATGADGISIENVGQPYYFGDVVREGDIGNGEYNIVVSENGITDSLDDGIEIVGSYVSFILTKVAQIYEATDGDYDGYGYFGNTGRVLVSDNTVLNSGFGESADGFGQAIDGNGGDGIHVRNVYPGYYGDVKIGESEGGFYGYAVDILGNSVTNSGDDGIEVLYSESTLIDDNIVKNSGFVSEGVVEEEPEFGLFADMTGYGADGIHVRDVGYFFKRIIDGDEEGPRDEVSARALPGFGYSPYSVVIRRNDVDNSLDNGIQVHNSLGYPTAPVLVEINENVSNSGNQALYISGPSHSDVIVRGNAFSNFDTGGQFESGLIDLSQIGNTWTNGNIGLRFSPTIIETTEGGDPIYASLNLVDDDGAGSTPYPTTPTNFGGTIGAQTFTGFTEDGKFYVYLDDGAFTNEGTPIWINGLNSNYDGIEPSLTAGLLSEDTFNYLEARFQHFPDNATTDIFWFGFFIPDDLPLIEQSLIFNRFNVFNGDATGLNVQIASLPSLGGGGGTTPALLNSIGPFAGNEATDPSSLNQIETAAGGENQPTDTQLNNVETAAGGQSQSCWGNAVAAAGNGQVVNVVYTGGFAANLNQAASCGTGF